MSLLHKITSLAARRYEREKAVAIAKAAAQMATKLGQPTKVVLGKPSAAKPNIKRGPSSAGPRASSSTPAVAGRKRKRIKRDADGSVTIEDADEEDDSTFLDGVFLDAESPFIGDLAAR